METLGWIIAAVLFLLVVGLVLLQVRSSKQAAQHGHDVRRLAQEEADSIRERAEASIASQRAELRDLRADHERREARLHEREDRLAAEAEGLLVRQQRVDSQRSQLKDLRARLDDERDQVTAELERVAGITREAAREEILTTAEHDARIQATAIARDIEQTAKRDANKRARSIVATAIQRCAAEQTVDSVVASVHLPNDDMKGRVIGREGRNIRSFEQITGVNVVIDDTPETVLLSCFDPVRREAARLTLEDLVADGRIHPARIEEVHAKSTRAMDDRILHHAEDALAEVGITDLDPELYPYLGALAFRTSYGQNVLKHLTESAHIAGVMAAELGIDVASCKRAAFLHDIGKALTHEHEGPHAKVGADLLRKHGENADIVHAVEAHHNEVEPTTVEAILVQAADAVSGARPGARRESIEAYVQRMDQLERLAKAHDGVDKVYAMQAGRDVRIMVAPDVIDDASAQALARDIAQEIQNELTYPGQVKITVVRESRATAVAQ